MSKLKCACRSRIDKTGGGTCFRNKDWPDFLQFRFVSLNCETCIQNKYNSTTSIDKNLVEPDSRIKNFENFQFRFA